MKRIPLRISNLDRNQKRAIALVVDFTLITLALWLSISTKKGHVFVPDQESMWLIILAPVIAIPVFIQQGLYRAIYRYMGLRATGTVIRAVFIYSMLWGVALLLPEKTPIPYTVIVTNFAFSLILIGSSRILAKWSFSPHFFLGQEEQTRRRNVVIYGAGEAGSRLASALQHSRELRPVCYIDDNITIKHHEINGLRIYSFSELSAIIDEMHISDVLLAMPSISRRRRQEILTLLEPYPVHVRTLPAISDLAEGHIKVEDIREVSIDDLLGRETVSPNQALLKANITNKTVLVTGAGGSIGSELCRQIIDLSPKCLILFEQSEYALYTIEMELRKRVIKRACNTSQNVSSICITPFLGSILNKERMVDVMRTFSVNTIYHAAAYKHVPMVEHNPGEAVMNNVHGTFICAQAAMECMVETFVLISTDKAVRPTNTMGATKRLAELVLQGLSSGCPTSTRFTMVRFGNVLGSSGSVVPLFREQIGHGGPVTVTDPRIIRFFMTIPEAAQLVIQAGAMGKGGDVFVLDMGKPVLIMDLATRMIRLSGLTVRNEDNPNGDIEIKITGLRPGEKLYEELLIGDNVMPTDHPRIMRAIEKVMPWARVETFLDELFIASKCNDQEKIRNLLLDAIEEYRPQCGIEDWIYKFKQETSAHLAQDLIINKLKIGQSIDKSIGERINH